MIKLTPVENDDKKLFHEIAINKKIKNSHCTGCKEDKGLCDACNFGNRGKMLGGVEPYVFKRYDLYLSYKSHLDSISQEDIIDEDTKELIR